MGEDHLLSYVEPRVQALLAWRVEGWTYGSRGESEDDYQHAEADRNCKAPNSSRLERKWNQEHQCRAA